MGLWPPRARVVGAARASDKFARAALKRNFDRAAGRILCRGLKYATGYSSGVQHWMYSSNTCENIQPSLIPDVHRFAYDSIFCYAHKGESHAL
ncbi:hypothetical protein V6N13_037029 [Hibiscus sabdariffa]